MQAIPLRTTTRETRLLDVGLIVGMFYPVLFIQFWLYGGGDRGVGLSIHAASLTLEVCFVIPTVVGGITNTGVMGCIVGPVGIGVRWRSNGMLGNPARKS